MGSNEIMVDVRIVRHGGPAHQKSFRDCQFHRKRCAHDICDDFQVRMTDSQWRHIAQHDDRFILYQAAVRGRVLDVTTKNSGMLASPANRIHSMDHDVCTCGELFAGGFSGWTQALRRLEAMNFKIDHRFALECDAECVMFFSKSHDFKHVFGPEDFSCLHDDLPTHVLLHADVKIGGWMHLIGCHAYDFLMMSPPCPPWSMATSAQGLMKEDGRLTLVSFGLCNLIRPKVLLFENVAAMKSHDQWSFLRDMLHWCGYNIRFSKCMNLNEVGPQNRDRLILVATLEGADLHPHIPTSWPLPVRPTLESFDAILTMEEPWSSQCRLEPDVMKMYLDPDLMPSTTHRRNLDVKRLKQDFEQYRLRFPESTFGCVMANYAYGHLLPQVNLKTMGLFGTLLVTPESIRFLSIPEILILRGGLVSCFLPKCHRTAVRMLGNAIATQHALIAICNGIAFLQGLTPFEVQEIFTEAVSRRMMASNIKWTFGNDETFFEVDELACRPTVLMHAIKDVTLKCPTEVVRIHAESGVPVLEGLKLLTGDAMPSQISLIPGGNVELRVSMPNNFVVKDSDVCLFSDVPTAIRIQLSAFHANENQSPCIVVLSQKGTFVFKREFGMNVADVISIMNQHVSVRCAFLVGILGENHPPDMICPNVVIARDFISSSDNLQVLDFIRIHVGLDEVSFHADNMAMKLCVELFQKTALDEILECLGWFLVVSAEGFVARDVSSLHLIRKPGAIALVHDDMVYFLALQMFLTRIRNWSEIGVNPTIFCRIKLWRIWVWEGYIDANVTLDHFDRVWNMICGWFGINKPWRYVVGNRTVNPSWPLHGFISPNHEGETELKVFLLLGMHGGGAPSLRSVSQVRTSETAGSFAHMADLEADSFQGAMRTALQKLVDESDRTVYADISNFLELEMTFSDDLPMMIGPYDMLRSFVDALIQSGIEKCLAFCGWLVVCHFDNIFDPVEAQILFVRKPSTPAVSIDFLRALLHASMVYLGMPKPVHEAHDAIKTKIKLWGAVIFHANLPRDCPIQDFFDIWDQAATFTGFEKVIRLVSHTGCTANPDFSLRHYSRCGPDDTTVASLSFMGAIHGGGPGVKNPANKQTFTVQQKNALATLMIAQGIDLQECVRYVDSLLKNAGPDAIEAILNQKAQTKKWEGLVRLSDALRIPIPDTSSKVDKARRKVQQKFHEQSKDLDRMLPIDLLQLQDGFLKNCDETPCVQIQKIQPNCSGVVLSSFQDAKPWLENGCQISQDELSLIVVGSCHHPISQDCQKIRVPVLLHGEPLVVSGCLHHLGAQKATISIDDQFQFPVNETQVVSVTAFADEMTSDTWNSLRKSPVKCMLQVLSQEAGDVTLLSPPWGRSFQRNGKKCDAELATSIQIHIRIEKGDLRRILKASGNAGLYCTPKTEDRKIMSDYMVIWLHQSAVEFAVSLSKVDSHCGIVRNSRGDLMNKGIRFEKADYVHAFAILKPDEKVPQIVLANHHFKIAPIPLGSTMDQVQTWISSQQWEAKPVKPLSGDCWLCVAEKRFDVVFAQWNGNPVLIRWMEDRKEHSPVILAGDMQRRQPAKKNDSLVEAAPPAASGVNDDPWGTWIANKGGTGICLASAIPKPSNAALPPRKLESPIEDRFTRHDTALQDYKQHTEQELDTLKESIARIERSIDLQNTNIQANLEMTNAEFKSIRSETASQLQALTGAFTESLRSTIASQEDQMSQQFAELKEMIMASSVSKSSASPPQKKSKKNGADDNDL